MKIDFYEVADRSDHLKYVVLQTVYKDQWVFVQHRDRHTWEMPGGHIEEGEDPDQAAKRELWEETGALEFDLVAVSDYSVDSGQGPTYGRLYRAHIRVKGDLPNMEIGDLMFDRSLPHPMTYPDIQVILHDHINEMIGRPFDILPVSEPEWLTWGKQLQSLAQQGLEYSRDKYDIERFEAIREISKDIMAKYTDMSHQKLTDLFTNEKGYQTPKVDVRSAVFKEDRILLVKESFDGKWSLPGGWAEFDLSVKANAMKELKEEAGVEAVPERIIAVQDRRLNNPGAYPYGIYKIFVLCAYIGGEFVENNETEASGYFDRTSLPELSVTRNTQAQIEMCFDAKDSEDWLVQFD